MCVMKHVPCVEYIEGVPKYKESPLKGERLDNYRPEKRNMLFLKDF